VSAAFRARQIWIIARLQLGRVFFSKRSFWVYLLALFPSIIFLGHGIESRVRRERLSSRIVSPSAIEAVREGDTDEQVLQQVGKPSHDRTSNRRRDRGRGESGTNETVRRYMQYFDGARRWDLNFEAGILQSKRSHLLLNFEEDREVFAGVFQYFYLRLAIFFGCLGIFMNLFRGEMLDKTLHFWFLAPARREVLLAGKYAAGLMAAVLIFTGGAALAFVAMLWPHDPAQVQAFWQTQGLSHLFWYSAAAALGCVGYGSVFLAAGLLLRNPIIPAITILSWESINGILPAALQKLSVLYYVQSLCPVPAPMDAKAPLLIRLLSAPAEPPSAALAVFGLLGVTAVVLLAASRAVRRLEVSYSAD
jgi:hypothetical protein